MQSRKEFDTLLPFNLTLPLILLIEGFISIAIEILTIRQLIPFTGSNVLVTSLIIGVFLLFLALGYQHGGRNLENPLKKLQINFFIASVWVGVGLSYIFIDFFFVIAHNYLGTHILFALLPYLLLIIAPLIFLLGQTVPISMNLIKENLRAGRIGGNALSLSTIGSFLGATLTTVVLMTFLGVAWTVEIILSLLILLVVLVSEKEVLQTNFMVGITIIGFMYFINNTIEKENFILTDNYANYQILKSDDLKTLKINNAYSSALTSQNKGYRYLELIKKILFEDLGLRGTNILVLGAGGFTLGAENSYGNHITYVDIDKKILDVTKNDFTIQPENEFIHDDARHYLRTSDKKYAAIVSDTFTDLKAIPAHLLTYEYLNTLKQRLTSHGVAIFNIISNPTLADAYSKRIDNTIRSVFKNCMTIPLNYYNGISNVIYTCSNEDNDKDKVIYTDNLNNSTTDAFSW